MRPLRPLPRAAVAVVVVVVVVVVAAGLYVLWAFDPTTAGFFPPCPFYALSGLQCPGCGATRAAHALLHGDVARAWALNPFILVLGAAFALKLVTPPLPDRVAVFLSIAVVVASLVFGVARNL